MKLDSDSDDGFDGPSHASNDAYKKTSDGDINSFLYSNESQQQPAQRQNLERPQTASNQKMEMLNKIKEQTRLQFERKKMVMMGNVKKGHPTGFAG
jgi:hypothetical protein